MVRACSLEQVNSLREIQAMRRLSPHTNILELSEVIFDKKSGTLMLICELMDMNIYELIRGRSLYLPEKKIKHFMYQLLKSVDYMHRMGIFHRDIKPENILIKDNLLKLADFGSCRSVYSKQPYTEYISTRWYRAPECLLTDGYYTYKMDIWSIGCVFFEVMSLHPLFPGANEVDQIAKIHEVIGTPDPSVLSKLRNKTRGMNFNFPPKKGSGIEVLLPHASRQCVQIIISMCEYDPEQRTSAKHILRHPYFKEFRDADKPLAAATSWKQEGSTPRDVPQRKSDKENVNESMTSQKDVDSDKVSVGSVEAKKKKKSPPVSFSSLSIQRHNVAQLNKHTALMQLNKQERRKRRHRTVAESGGNQYSMSYYPKVVGSKLNTFHPTFPSNSFTLPKITGTSSTTGSYLPSLSQAFVKHAAKVKVCTKGTS
ncbi:MAPK/MAK/MRK overlapping kinase [Lamellibrachia satsuma]|nr:MAPK/MAK/MRK overlapping kinase [Lamellibrachia satsuma]